MVERTLRARARALHVREHGWWRTTHVADYGWTRAHEEASRNIETATEKITDMKDKVAPIIEERDSLKKQCNLIKERLCKHKKGATTLRKLLQKSVDGLQANAEKLESGRSRLRELENETKVLGERNSQELAKIKEEIEMLSKNSGDLEKEWMETRETDRKLQENQCCELQCINEECVKTCHELVKIDAENDQIRSNIKKNGKLKHKCRPDLARDIKMLVRLQQELEEILTISQNKSHNKHEQRMQTKKLPRQCNGSIDIAIFLDCLTRTLELCLNKSISDGGDVIPCDLLKSVVDNVEISEDTATFLKCFLKCHLAKNLYASIEKCLEENGVEVTSNAGGNEPNGEFCTKCISESQTKSIAMNKYGTTNQPNEATIMQITNNYCRLNKCPAENLTQSGDHFSTCCLDMDTIYVIPLKKCDEEYSPKTDVPEIRQNNTEQNVDPKIKVTSYTEIPLGCIEYEFTCSNSGTNRNVCNRSSDTIDKNDCSLGDKYESANILNRILEEKCDTKVAEHHYKTENSQRVQYLPSAEPNLKNLYILPTCSENFENLGTLTPISSIDLNPGPIDQRLSACPYCLRETNSKESRGNLSNDTSYAKDFINMVVLGNTCENNDCTKMISEKHTKKSRLLKDNSEALIAECLRAESCLQCNENIENILECGEFDAKNEEREKPVSVDIDIQCEECISKKNSEKSCFEKLLQEIDIPKFLNNLLIAISHKNEVGCLCDTKEIETNTSIKLFSELNKSENLCFCDAKECMCELKAKKNDPYQCNSLNECSYELKSPEIENCKCQKNYTKSSNKIPGNSEASSMLCLCNKPLKESVCEFKRTEIDDCVCQEIETRLESIIPSKLKTKDVLCLCDKPTKQCTCKYEQLEIDNCECQEIVTKLSSKTSTNSCNSNCTGNLIVATEQSQDVLCICEKPLKKCFCDENILNPKLSNLIGNITEKTLSNLCVCDKCENIHLNLLKKLVKCASMSCPESSCFADEIIKKIGSLQKICRTCSKCYDECNCNSNHFDIDKIDEIIGTPKQIRSMTTNTFCVNMEKCTSYSVAIDEQKRESDLKSHSNISELHTGAVFVTPQHSASKLGLHSMMSNQGLCQRIKSLNSVSFTSPKSVEEIGSNIISCECSEPRNTKNAISSKTVCNSNQEIEKKCEDFCQYNKKQTSSNTSDTCNNKNLTSDEIIKLFLDGTNLEADDLRKALNERLYCLKNSLDCIGEDAIKKDSCVNLKSSPGIQCSEVTPNVINRQCSSFKKDATNSISGIRFPCSMNDAFTSPHNNSAPFPIEYPSSEILKKDCIPAKDPPSIKYPCSGVKNLCLVPKKPNKVSDFETLNIMNKPMSPKKHSPVKFPCSEVPNIRNITYSKQRSPNRATGSEKPPTMNKPFTPRKYSPKKCPADPKNKSPKRNCNNKSDLSNLNRKQSNSNLSCDCVEETLKFTDYTEGDRISIGCSAQNTQVKCTPLRRNTINSQVPSKEYPSTPYNSVTTCYNDIDEIPTRLMNCNTTKYVDEGTSQTSQNNETLSSQILCESQCSRATSCSSLPKIVEKYYSNTVECKSSKETVRKTTESYCEIDKCHVMTDTESENKNDCSCLTNEPCYSQERKFKYSKTVYNSSCQTSSILNQFTNKMNMSFTDTKVDRTTQHYQSDIEQNELLPRKCLINTCIFNTNGNKSYTDTENVKKIPKLHLNDPKNDYLLRCNCFKGVPCTCERLHDENTQRNTKLTCSDGTSCSFLSNATCRKRKIPTYSQSDNRQQNGIRNFELEKTTAIVNRKRGEELMKSYVCAPKEDNVYILECKCFQDETCICKNRKIANQNCNGDVINNVPILKCSISTCVSFSKSNLASDELCTLPDNNKTTDNNGLTTSCFESKKVHNSNNYLAVNKDAYNEKCRCSEYAKEKRRTSHTIKCRCISPLSLNNKVKSSADAKTQNNCNEYDLETSNEISECNYYSKNDSKEHDTLQNETPTEKSHNVENTRRTCRDISSNNQNNYDNCNSSSFSDKDTNRTVIFCSVKPKSCIDQPVENVSNLQSECKTIAWKQRYIVLKPKSQSFSSCNRNTCVPLTNKEDKILIQVSNTANTDNILVNNKSTSFINTNEALEKYDGILGMQENDEITSGTQDKSDEDMQEKNVEKSQTDIENYEITSETQDKSDEDMQEKNVEKSQTDIDNDEITSIQDKSNEDMPEKIVKKSTTRTKENYTKTSPKKDEGTLARSNDNMQMKGKLYKAQEWKYEKCKSQERNYEICGTKKRKHDVVKTQQKYDKIYGTHEKQYKECTKQENNVCKYNVKMVGSEKCICNNRGKKKSSCECTL